jgi:hypothetical protein
MKKGSEIVAFRKHASTLHNLFRKLFKQRGRALKRELLYNVISDMKKLRSETHEYLETLPTRFSRNYSEEDYIKDINNIKLYYTKWTREDVFRSKASLKRVRQYEKREGLEAFDLILEREGREVEFKRLSELYG